MKKTLSVFILLLFIFPALSSAMDGMEIYRKYMENEKKIENKIKNAVFEHESTSEGMVINGKIYIKEDKSRMESVVIESPDSMMIKKGHKTIMIDDGKNIYTFSSEGEFHSFPKETDDEEEPEPVSVKYIGKEKVSALECYRIEVEFDFGEKSEMWISTDDFILVKESMDNGNIIELSSDFRNVSGIKMPFKSQTIEEGEVTETSILKLVKINENTDDSFYDPSKIPGYKKL
jgi:hypothetical protein